MEDDIPVQQIEQSIQKITLNQHKQLQQHPQALHEEQQQEESDVQGGKWQKIDQPQRKVPLFMVDFQQCDSKKCTGKKMERFKLLSTIKDKKKKYKGVVLSAFGKKLVSKQDLQYIQKYGICAIDCSWNRIEQTREFRYKHERKLPFVVAGNPVNFGKPYQLSCVQAMATALCAIDYVQQAKFIMSKFGWADGFWKQNPNIEDYSRCGSLQDMQKQSKINEQREEKEFQRNYDYPSDDDEEAEQVQLEKKEVLQGQQKR